MKQMIQTAEAPQAIGTYSQAIKVGSHIYISGQIPLDPQTMQLVNGGIEAQIRRVFDNLIGIVNASGASLENIVKLNVYLTDLINFPLINEIMKEYFNTPFPARAVIGVSALPKESQVEIDAIAYK